MHWIEKLSLNRLIKVKLHITHAHCKIISLFQIHRPKSIFRCAKKKQKNRTLNSKLLIKPCLVDHQNLKVTMLTMSASIPIIYHQGMRHQMESLISMRQAEVLCTYVIIKKILGIRLFAIHVFGTIPPFIRVMIEHCTRKCCSSQRCFFRNYLFSHVICKRIV